MLNLKLNFSRIGALAALILVPSIFSGCFDSRKKEDHYSTYKIKGCNIYREKYTVSHAGMYGGAIYADYLTDSVSYRVVVGRHTENQNYKYEYKNDTVFIDKMSIENRDSVAIIDSKIYTVAKMKKTGFQ